MEEIDSCSELVVFVLFLGHIGKAADPFESGGAQMPWQARLGERRKQRKPPLQIVGKVRFDNIVGLDAGGLNGPARGRVVPRGCNKRAFAAKRNNSLHAAFAKRTSSDHVRPFMILERPGYDFGGGRRSTIDQDHQRRAAGDIAMLCPGDIGIA